MCDYQRISHAEIDLKYKGDGYHGVSGRNSETENNMNKWPELARAFREKVDTASIYHSEEGREEVRPWNQCAEPNALSNLVAQKAANREEPDLSEVVYPQWAQIEVENQSGKKKHFLEPCAVCSKWIEKKGGNRLVIGDNLITENGPLNKNYYKKRYKELCDQYKIKFENGLTREVYTARFKLLEKENIKAKSLSDTIPRHTSIEYDIFVGILNAGFVNYGTAQGMVGELRESEADTSMKAEDLKYIPNYQRLKKIINFEGALYSDKIIVCELDLNYLEIKARIIGLYMECAKGTDGKVMYYSLLYWYKEASILSEFTPGVREKIMSSLRTPVAVTNRETLNKILNRVVELESQFYLSQSSEQEIKSFFKEYNNEDLIAEYKASLPEDSYGKMYLGEYIEWCKRRQNSGHA